MPTAQASTVGFVLVDSSLRPIYANSEAVKILIYPESVQNSTAVETLLVQKIRAIFQGLQFGPGSGSRTDFFSGKRRYHCRIFTLTLSYKNGSGSELARALLLERNRECHDLSELAEKFKLTQREQQVVELLVQGLTSKEIANRMRISPNTVKAFLRLVMSKTGVSTRSGIVGTFLRNQRD